MTREEVLVLVQEFYALGKKKSENGVFLGGPLHIITDDNNIESEHIDWCIENAYVSWRRWSDEVADKGVEVARAMLGLDMDDREWVVSGDQYRSYM